MNCPECDKANIGSSCPACGWGKGRAEKASPPRTGHTSPPPLVSIQCEFRTGQWQCRWGRYTREPHKIIYCPFHEQILRDDTVRTSEQFAKLVAEREWMQGHYPFVSFLNSDDLARYSRGGKAAVQTTPFWYEPLEVQWKCLTGLPMPTEQGQNLTNEPSREALTETVLKCE